MLRLANKLDSPVVISLLEQLHANSAYAKLIPFQKGTTSELFEKLLDSKNEDACCILSCLDTGETVGLIICSSMGHMFNKDERTAIEIAFWINPKYRTFSRVKELLKAYHYWAKKIGCSSILTGTLQGTSATEIYKIRRIK